MTDLRTLNGSPLSALTFGAMQFGGGADASASQALFELSCIHGINHFDTAVGYNDGASEQLIGPMIADKRDAMFLATKIGYQGGAGRENLMAQFDRSRRQLGLDQIDLLYLHRWDNDAPLHDTFETLAAWQSRGLIRHIGVSNYAA